MRIRNLLFYFLFSFLAYGVAAQKHYNQQQNFINANRIWVLPDSSGIDFSKNPRPQLSVTRNVLKPKSPTECMASVSDPMSGNLLFYSNGRECWSADGSLMPNGTGLLGDTLSSTMQGVIGVPVLGEKDKYYLFSLMYQGGVIIKDKIKGSLFYNVIDMSLNGGKGDIVTGKKNLPLDSVPLSEAMIAIPGDNCDIWLVVHHLSLPMYRAYHITSEGIASAPVISMTNGAVLQDNEYLQGTFAVSPNRKFLASNYINLLPLFGGLMLCQFEASTGKVSNEIQIGAPSVTSIQTGKSVAFSPDNSKLYADHGALLLQFDISKYDTSSINNSRFVLGTLPTFKLRLYNDTIYGCRPGSKYLSAITEPNKMGAASNYNPNALLVDAGNFKGYGLPTEIVFPVIPPTAQATVLDTVICSGIEDGIIIGPVQTSPTYSYLWNNTSIDSSLTVYKAGKYWVTYTNGCNTYTDTFVLSSENGPEPIVSVNGFKISAGGGYKSYLWLLNGKVIAGATDSVYTVLENGNYQVVVRQASGCIDTSAAYPVTNVEGNSVADLSKWTSQVQIFPNPAVDWLYINAPIAVDLCIFSLDGRMVKKVKNAQAVSLADLANGYYYINVVDGTGLLLKVQQVVRI